jgi:hypothetical protein
MANPTSNFGWQMPTPVDLVTDLPADFEVFGQAVDSSLADLKGGTSGQVLSKNSNTDMDFVWVTSDDANAIQNTIVDAKGDLIAATAADTPARLAIGTNNAFLKADSTAATGMVWDNSGWISYTPGTSNLTVGNGTLTGFYKRIGVTTHWRAAFVLGSTSAISNDAYIGDPVGAVVNQGANAFFIDSSAAGWFNGWWYGGYPRYQSTFGTLTATNPFTWATGDSIFIYGTYEGA